MTQYHVGIDLHKSVAQVCVRDDEGEIVEEKRLRVPDAVAGQELISWLARYREQGRFAVEAIGCNRWFVNSARAQGLEILVVNPTKLGLKKEGKKTDRRDARKIARLLRLGDLDRFAKTYFPTDEEYGERKVIRVRHALLKERVRTVCQIRGLLNAYLLRPPTTELYEARCLGWLKKQELPTEDLTCVLQTLTQSLESVTQAIKKLDSRIRARKKDPEISLLMEQLPSVGPQTAMTLRAELGDVQRFRHARAAAAYGGLVPRVSASADRSHHGRLTRRGSPELRWILTEWAVRLLRGDPMVKRWAEPMLRRMHKNKVRMALARRLLVSVWVMLTRGETFSMRLCLGVPA